jgi:hypothetical protein
MVSRAVGRPKPGSVKDPDYFALYLREAYQHHLGLTFDTCYVCPVDRRR